jgi:hypothetical protein
MIVCFHIRIVSAHDTYQVVSCAQSMAKHVHEVKNDPLENIWRPQWGQTVTAPRCKSMLRR